jgi:hypothetical protein
MTDKRSTRRHFLTLAVAGGTLAFARPGLSSARGGAGAAPPQNDRPIVVRGGSVNIEFDENTYTGSNGKYTGANRQLARVTFTRPNGEEQECAGTGPISVRCTNPQTTITIQNSGPDLAVEFDEDTFQGSPGSGRRGNPDARLRDLRNGTVTCSPGVVSTITIHTR